MSKDAIYVRSDHGWRKGESFGGGEMFNITWDRLERLLKGDPATVKEMSSYLKGNEYIKRTEIDRTGVVIVVGRHGEK